MVLTAAVVWSLAGAVVIIAFRTVKDIPTALIAVITLLAMIYFKKIKEPLIIVLAALAGLMLKLFTR